MSSARAAVLEQLGTIDGPATVGVVARACGQHVNTVREHLEALVSAGLVQRERAPVRGRGRPANLYRVVPPELSRPAVREYASLASALAGHIARTSRSPQAEAQEAGRAWGLELAGQVPASPPLVAAEEVAASATLELFTHLGFAPEVTTGGDGAPEVLLRECPLLQAAKAYPEVVCHVHLGLVRGLYEAHGADGSGAQVVPFDRPGSCLLRLPGCVAPPVADGDGGPRP